MSDYSELTRLAQRVIDLEAAEGDAPIGEAWDEFEAVATPSVVLVLIAENNRLKALRSTIERDLAQELEVWRHGPSCWNCGDTGDVHDIVGEWRGKCDCNAARLIDVSSERDHLKAEVAGLKTGYEAYERVNAELKAEVEGLRKALESCAEEFAAEVICKHGGQKLEDMHPVTRRLYERDMAPVIEARAALGKGEQA